MIARGRKGNGVGRLLVVLLALLAVSACDALGGLVGRADSAAQEPAPVMESVEAGPIAAFIDEIPDAEVRDFDLETALTLVAMPLSCLDRPHAAPRDRSTYLDEIVAARRPGFERNRAFYGCWDWHSAVNSTWAMVRIYKEFPHLPVSGLVVEKLRDHLSGQAMQGEVEFFTENSGFERPYGYAWLLKLYAELSTWDHPDAARWARNVQPLAELFSERMVQWLPRLERPSRSGAHSNTAFALAMMLEYAEVMEDTALRDAIAEAAPRLYGNDRACPTAYEPWGSDFLSPCLEEAALMAAVLEPAGFAAWFDGFMPAVTSREFLPLTTPVYAPEEADEEAEPVRDETPAAFATDPEATAAAEPPVTEESGQAGEQAAAEGEEGGETDEEAQRAEATRELASRSHLIGLAFIRADAMNRIADALPAGDPRIDAYRRLAKLHGEMGFTAMFDADYAGSHWIGTFALKYLLTEQ
jgi:hypothetical protein